MPIVDVATNTQLWNDFVEGTVEAEYSGMTVAQIYEAKCTANGLPTNTTLHTLNGDDVLQSINLGFSPFPLAGNTKITFTTEGLIYLYFTSSNTTYGNDKLTRTGSPINTPDGDMARVLFDNSAPVTTPSVGLLFKALFWDGEVVGDSKVQHNNDVCLFYVSQQRWNSGGDIEYCLELLPSGQVNIYASNTDSGTGKKIGLLSFNQSDDFSSGTLVADSGSSRVFTMQQSSSVVKYNTLSLVTYEITGNINKTGIPYVTARVNLLRKSDKALVGTSTPDANGDFTINVFDANEYILLCEDLAVSDPKNALVIDRVVGTLVV